jgi:hypothetical protein
MLQMDVPFVRRKKENKKKDRTPKNKDPVDPLEFVGTKNGKEYVATMACLNCR